MVISKDNIARLDRNARLMSLVDNSYLTDTENDNFSYIQKKFFPYEPIDKVKTLNTGTGFFNRVATIKASYVSTPEYDIPIDIEDCTRDYETLGFACLGLGYNGREVMTYRLPSEGYFYQDGVHNIARIYQRLEGSTKEKASTKVFYVFIQSFYPGYTENKLYKSMTTGILDYQMLTSVPLDTLPETAAKQERVTTLRDKPAMILMTKDEDDVYPVQSNIDQIKNHIYAMDRRKVMFDTQFLKNVESYVVFSGMSAPQELNTMKKAGMTPTTKDISKIMFTDNENAKVQFVSNKNDLLPEAMEQQRDDIRQLSAMTSIPLDYLGMDTAHAIGQGSRSMLHGSFIKEIKKIRHIRDRYLPQVIEMLRVINSELEERYSRPEIFSKDDTELLNEMVIAKKNDLISHERALMLYNDYTKEEAEQEMEAIREQKEQNSLLLQNNESTIPPSDSGEQAEDRTDQEEL